MRVALLGSDYSYVNAPQMSGWWEDVTSWGKEKLKSTADEAVDKITGRSDVPPALPEPTFMDKYGLYIGGGAVLIGALYLMKKKRR